jgi:hypothetical protein
MNNVGLRTTLNAMGSWLHEVFINESPTNINMIFKKYIAAMCNEGGKCAAGLSIK